MPRSRRKLLLYLTNERNKAEQEHLKKKQAEIEAKNQNIKPKRPLH